MDVSQFDCHRSSLAPAPRLVLQLAVFAMLFTALANASLFAQSDTQLKRLEKAAALISENHIEDAEKELRAILTVSPNDPAALNLLGTIRAKQGHYAEAESLFSRAISSDPGFVGAHLNLAYLYTLTGKPDKTIIELKEVLRVQPDHAEALDRLARLLLAQGNIDEGIHVLEEGGKSHQLSSPLLVLLGDAYLKKRNVPSAEESYKAGLAQDAQNTDAVLGLAQIAQVKGDADSATALLGRARKMVATSPDTLYRFAIVAMRAGLYEEANRILLAAIKEKSDDPSYFVALGDTWIKKPDIDEAEKAFRRALELRPNDPQVQMYLGYILLQQKKYSEASDWLDKSLRQDKTIPETYYYLGQIAQEQNQDLRAIEFFNKAIQLAPDYSFAHAGLGACYLQLKNYPLAQRELELSIKIDPNNRMAHYSLAILFARLNNQERSQAEMTIVEKLKNAEKSKPDTTPPPPGNPR